MTGDNRKKGKMIAIVFIALLVFIKTLLRPFGILDELWNYNLQRCGFKKTKNSGSEHPPKTKLNDECRNQCCPKTDLG